MSVLHIAPDSHVLVHAAAAAVLSLHIGTGTLGLRAGVAGWRKGSRVHRQASNVFVVAMLVLSAIGATVAPFLPTPERASVIAGVLTLAKSPGAAPV